MDRSSRTRVLAKAPCGFLAMLALVSAFEWCVVRGNLAYVDTVADSWRYAGRVVEKKAPGCEVLYFGDSNVKFGIAPPVIRQESGLKGFNLALHSGSAASSYFLLERALEAGARPLSVVVDFSRIILGDGPGSTTRLYPWADLLSLGETARLGLDARDPRLFASVLTRRFLPSFRGRFEIRSAVTASLSGGPNHQGENNAVQERNWAVNSGGHVAPNGGRFEDIVIPKTFAPKQGTWVCDPVNLRYVERFIGLAARHHVTVYWLLPPVSPGTQSQWEYMGDEAPFIDLVQRVLARHGNLVVVDGRDSGFGADLFTDGVHLGRAGAVGLSAGLAAVLKGRAPSRGDGRWVRLPEYNGERTRGLVVEDLVQSKMALDRVRR
jgi:hypothetical protein